MKAIISIIEKQWFPLQRTESSSYVKSSLLLLMLRCVSFGLYFYRMAVK